MTLPRRLCKPGPIIEYVVNLQKVPGTRKIGQQLIRDIRSALATPAGLILLEVLDKAILERSISIDADPRALDANNAQSFIALDLRRILSDEFNATVDDTSPPVGTPR